MPQRQTIYKEGKHKFHAQTHGSLDYLEQWFLITCVTSGPTSVIDDQVTTYCALLVQYTVTLHAL